MIGGGTDDDWYSPVSLTILVLLTSLVVSREEMEKENKPKKGNDKKLQNTKLSLTMSLETHLIHACITNSVSLDAFHPSSKEVQSIGRLCVGF